MKGNVNTTMDWTFVPNASGEATMNMINISQGNSRVSVAELIYSE
jgi:hypothetical protein